MHSLRILGFVSLSVILGGSAQAQWTVTSLHPAGVSDSEAHGVGGGQQGGSAWDGVQQRASLWTGTAASWVDLSPAGTAHSGVNGVSGGQQVGWATTAEGYRASLWS